MSLFTVVSMLPGSKSPKTKRTRKRSLPKVPRVTITPSDLCPLSVEDDYHYSVIPSSYLNKSYAEDFSHYVDVPGVDAGKGDDGGDGVEGMSYWRAPSVDGPYIDIDDQLCDQSCSRSETFLPSSHAGGSGDVDLIDGGGGISCKGAPDLDNSYIDIDDQLNDQSCSGSQTFLPSPHGGGGIGVVVDGGKSTPDLDNSYVDIDQLSEGSGSSSKIISTHGRGGKDVRSGGSSGSGGVRASYKRAPVEDNSYVDIDQLSDQCESGSKIILTHSSGGSGSGVSGNGNGSSDAGRVRYKSAPGEDYSYVDIDQLSDQSGSGVQTFPSQCREGLNPAVKWHTLPQPQISFDEDIRLPVRRAARDESLSTVSIGCFEIHPINLAPSSSSSSSLSLQYEIYVQYTCTIVSATYF